LQPQRKKIYNRVQLTEAAFLKKKKYLNMIIFSGFLLPEVE